MSFQWRLDFLKKNDVFFNMIIALESKQDSDLVAIE